MTTTRAQYRAHIGKALGRNYYIASTTTGTSADANEIVDAARTENDDFWNGATVRIGSDDRPLRGGAGVNTNRSPTLYVDRALSSRPQTGTAYEVLKTWTFTDVDEAIDDALASLWPQFYDPVDDITTVVEASGTLQYPLPATWMEVDLVQRQIVSSSPIRYRDLRLGFDYELRDDAASRVILLNYLPFAGTAVRIFAKAIPTLGATDASTSIHPWQVVVPGALAYLYQKGANADQGSLSQAFDRKALFYATQFEKRKVQFHQHRAASPIGFPVIAVG